MLQLSTNHHIISYHHSFIDSYSFAFFFFFFDSHERIKTDLHTYIYTLTTQATLIEVKADMDERSNISTPKSNREGRPLRRRNVSFNVLPLREEPTPNHSSPQPILVDYVTIHEPKQLNFSDFLHSDNPITFFLFTYWHAVCLFGRLFLLPFIIIKHLYLLMLRVYGVRRPTTSTTTSDLFSISYSQSSTSQQRPIVWILTLIDFIIIQLTRLPELIKHIISSIRKHIEGTVSKSFNLIDTCASHQITKTYFMFKSIFCGKNNDLNLKTKR